MLTFLLSLTVSKLSKQNAASIKFLTLKELLICQHTSDPKSLAVCIWNEMKSPSIFRFSKKENPLHFHLFPACVTCLSQGYTRTYLKRPFWDSIYKEKKVFSFFSQRGTFQVKQQKGISFLFFEQHDDSAIKYQTINVNAHMGIHSDNACCHWMVNS